MVGKATGLWWLDKPLCKVNIPQDVDAAKISLYCGPALSHSIHSFVFFIKVYSTRIQHSEYVYIYIYIQFCLIVQVPEPFLQK